MSILTTGIQRGASIDLKNCVLFAKTLTAGSVLVWIALKFGDGSLTHTINKSYDYKKSRGKLDDVRRGEEQVLDVGFEGKFTAMVANTGAGPDETYALHEVFEGVEYLETDHGEAKFAGTRESWLAAYGCPPYCVDLEIHNNPRMDCPASDAVGEAQLLRYFRSTSIAADFSTGMVNISGECHILRPMVRRPQPGTFPGNYTTEADAAPFEDWADDPRAV